MRTLSAERLRVGSGAPAIRDVRLLAPADGGDALDSLVAHAREQAFAAGLAQGRREAAEQQAGALAKAAVALEEERGRTCASLAQTAVELAVEVSRVLLRREVAAGRYELERMVRDTLESSSAGRARCVVHLNPADVAALEGVQFRSGTSLQADIGVARGDVHVETSLGLMVRELDGALESMAEALREMLP